MPCKTLSHAVSTAIINTIYKTLGPGSTAGAAVVMVLARTGETLAEITLLIRFMGLHLSFS